MKLLVEPSGEFPKLARSEILAVCEAEGSFCIEVGGEDTAVIVETDAPVEALASRLALAWHVDEFLFTCEIDELEKRVGGLEMPGESFAVRVRRDAGKWSGRQAQELAGKLGGILGEKSRARVDLEDPEVEVRVVLGELCHVGFMLAAINRSQFEERRPLKRPFESPVTLHPKLARALINLSGARAGETMLDPFCGTGGLLMEAATLGIKSVGSDIDPEMIDGTRRNLEHFGVSPGDYRLLVADVREIASHVSGVDVIVTDPPYGRSATTMKEGVEKLYGRAFEAFAGILPPGRKLAIVLPDPKHAGLGERHFALLSIDEVYVHRSLSRHFCVFEK